MLSKHGDVDILEQLNWILHSATIFPDWWAITIFSGPVAMFFLVASPERDTA